MPPRSLPARIRRHLWQLTASALLAVLLGACGGGGGGGGQPAPERLTMSGTVVNGQGSPQAGAAALLGLSLESTTAAGLFSFANLSAGRYVLSVQAVNGAFNSSAVDLAAGNTAFEFVVPDPAPFAVTGLSPLMTGAPVSLNSGVVLETSMPVDAASVESEDFTISPDPGELEVEVDGAEITLLPRLQLAPGQTYVFDYSGDIRSTSGTALKKPMRFILRTEATDTAPPVLLETQPPEGSAGHPTNRPLQFSFNETLAPDSTIGVSSEPEADLLSGISGRNVFIRAAGGWQPQTEYSVSISGLQDQAGNSLPAPVVLSFTTGSSAAPTTNIQPHWNRNSNSIVFSSNLSGSFDIWALNSDGSNLRQLSSEFGDEFWPSLSSDATLLCWQAQGPAGDSDVFVADISDGDSSDSRAVTGAPYNETQPVFSRTSSRAIFFVSTRSNPASLYSVDSTGGALTALDFSFGSNQTDPAPHPLLDTQLLFTSGRGGSNDIWRMIRSVIDNEVIETNLTDDLLSQDSQPDWLPDASGYVYISDRGGSPNLWLGDLSGGLKRQATFFNAGPSDPAMSPFSGSNLCALSLPNDSGGRDIVIIELVGGSIVSNLTGGVF